MKNASKRCLTSFFLQVVDYSSAKEYADQLGIPFLETSVRSRIRILPSQLVISPTSFLQCYNCDIDITGGKTVSKCSGCFLILAQNI
jgi:hypothetical protein